MPPFDHSNAPVRQLADPFEVVWWRDEHGHPQQTSRVNGEAAGWKPMSAKDFAKTFPTAVEVAPTHPAADADLHHTYPESGDESPEVRS